MSKRFWIGALFVLNAALLAAVVLRTAPPRAALAQQGLSLAGNYAVVTGEIQDGFDALYLLDTQARILHGFYWDRTQRSLRYADSRDLEADFRHNRD